MLLSVLSLLAHAEEPAPPTEPPAAPAAEPAPAPEPTAPDTAGPLLDEAQVLLDDRRDREERVGAAQDLGASGDPRALPFLRAAAAQPDPDVRHAAVTAALGLPLPDRAEPARVLLVDREAPKELRLEVVRELGDDGGDEAARALWDVGADEDARARIRTAALEELRRTRPDLYGSFGTPPRIADALGATSFVAASGLAGGIVMSSLGVWGQFDAGPALGAVGGSAIGLGTGALYVATNPVPAGDGLAFASGVSFGLAYGLWTTTAVHGAWRYLDATYSVVPAAAAWRALGVAGGTTVGALAMRGHPSAWDVLEVDVAGYLGEGVALGAAGLLLYHPPPGTTFGFTTCPTLDCRSPRADYDLNASRELAGAELVGATAGLVTGSLLHRRWHLGFDDGVFAGVLAGEGAWAGGWMPSLLATTDPQDVKGNVRLPLHAFAAGGLALAELADVGYGRSLSTAFGVGVGNALGAGLPLLAGYDDARSVAAWMIPVGLAGTAGGFLAEPLVRPTPGDATLVGVSTLVAGSTGTLVGLALDERGVWIDSDQAAGLGLVATGVAGVGSYAAARFVAPRVDELLLVGSGAAWGAGYGALVPLSISTEGDPEIVLWTTAATEVGFTGATALAARAGLRPRDTVVPQLVGLSGGTLGALLAALGSSEGHYVALGAVTGATAGFAIGAVAELATPDRRPVKRLARLRTTATVLPRFGEQLGAAGEPVPTVGVDVLGW